MNDRQPASVKDVAASRLSPRPPRATYRLQFHRGFTFAQATQLVPYFAALGISHCYASPYLKARPGSTHGYDITNHRVLNPEIGARFRREVLACGGSRPALESFVAFRGRKPQIDALLRHNGMTLRA